MRILFVFALLLGRGWGQTQCACDPAQPETMSARQCSLCAEAEKHDSEPVFFLKDTSPRKPNRWLVLPRKHLAANHPLEEMTLAERTELWTAAIQKAKELWGDDWGLAYNGPKVRTQCHTHIHIGKLLKGVEEGKVIVVSGAAQIPKPDGDGLWIHPVGGRLHVHLGEQTCETVLLR
jgi:diadenosine tetraphosphate (Ap4A) HIT family hydrolase